MSRGSSTKDLSILESGDWFDSKKDVTEQETENFKSVIINLLQKSSIYAVSQLVTSNGFGRRVLWFFVLLVGLLGCSYEIYHFLSLYFQYPVVITLEVKNSWKLDFPAVTVCNQNRISNRNYQCLLHNVPLAECDKMLTKKFRPTISERQRFSTCSKTFNGTFSKDRSKSLAFVNKYLQMDENDRIEYGSKVDDFISTCTFNGESCSIKNFTMFTSIQFGNCFVFNWKHKEHEKTLQTPYIGPNSGLDLTLQLDTLHYAPITSSIGARIVIHESDVDPNPEDQGINISPGYETSVTIQQTSIYRLEDPYRDKCKKYSGEITSYRNQASCIRNCIQNINLHRCGCVDPFLPTESSVPLCDLRNQSAVCCLEDVLDLFDEDSYSCSCPLPCKSTDYEMTISTAVWPAKRFFLQFLKKDFIKWKMASQRPNVKQPFNAPEHDKENATSQDFIISSDTTDNDCCSDCVCQDQDEYDEYREQFAKLKVFYKSLEKISYKQEPMFQDSELFSQLGGQLGLWLGISLVALFECVENLSHLLSYFFKKTGKSNRMNSYFQDDALETTTQV